MEQNVRPPLEELVKTTGLIFSGTVIELGASSVGDVKAATNLVVVRVSRGLLVDKALGDLRGKTITVVVRDPNAFRVGEQAVFFTRSWIHGQGIAVREVDHANLDLQDQVTAEVAKLPDAHLTDRLRSATLVVRAEVASVGPVERVSLDRNDALWRKATLTVSAVLRGSPRSPTVVHFPTSKHPDWARAPRLTEKQRGVFLLQSPAGSPLPTLAALPADALVVLDADDAQPESRLADVERLLGTIK
jgi:hypothetical protein